MNDDFLAKSDTNDEARATDDEMAKPIAESSQNVPNDELISRKVAIEALKEAFNPSITNFVKAKIAIDKLPPAQPEPMSEAYTKAVFTWLLEYQIKAAELKGRYTPYEVLSWVVNDWRKEHEGSD